MDLMRAARLPLTLSLPLIFSLASTPARGQCFPQGGNCSGNSGVKVSCITTANCEENSPDNPEACTPTGCGDFNACLAPSVHGPRIEVDETSPGVFSARLVLDVTARWNQWAGDQSASFAASVLWYRVDAFPSCTVAPTAECTNTTSDRFETYVEKTGLTCLGAPYTFEDWAVRVKICTQPCCFGNPNCICGAPSGDNATWREFEGLSFVVTSEMLGCAGRSPRKDRCGAKRCQGCVGPGVDAAGDGPSFGDGAGGQLSTGPGASLRYTARGVGHPGHPGAALVAPALGHYWMHEYARRIVVDPDPSHVWLLEEDATFREFTDVDTDGLYELASPSDEYRELSYSAASGWGLHELDGTIHLFDNAGLWQSTTDRNGNAKVATYNVGGQLSMVAMPDGRFEDFTYEASGKLKEIIERGVGVADCVANPTGCRRWVYLWSGPDLAEITRPDGTLLQFFYSDLRHPGFLTRIELLGTTGGSAARPRRVLAAYEYDAEGNVVKTWKGDRDFNGANAVDKWQLAFDNPALPVVTTVTDPLGVVSTYTFGRDNGSEVPRLEQLSGDCPSCGLGPNSQLSYQDPAHPLLPTREIDGNGHETSWLYDDHGQRLAQTEAVGTGLARTTLWEYHPNFPAFVTRISRPSVAGAPGRETFLILDALTGDVTQRREDGGESTYPGGAFSLATAITPNGAGQPLHVDPPSFGTLDRTSFTYDPLRGDLLPLTRTDPVVGTSTLSYDVFNHLIRSIDPNGVPTDREYDGLSRIRRVLVRGTNDTTETDDLVTRTFYTSFGDVGCAVQPAGNGTQYLYDSAGRLVELISGRAQSSPNAVSCLLTNQLRERMVYTLNGAGQRVNEKRERTTATTFTTESETAYEYSTRCHLDRVRQAPGRPEESVTEYAYDCAGNLKRLWDGNHPSSGQSSPATQVYDYDELDRLTTVTQPWAGAGGGSAVTSYGYDVQDHLTTVADAEGNVTSYVYSDRDLMTRETMPWLATAPSCPPGTCNVGCGCTGHSYNDHGELESTTDARGITLTRTLDPGDRVTLVDYPGTELDIGYLYDVAGSCAASTPVGRLSSITRNGGIVAYCYDRFGRTTQDGALTMTHDKNGNPLTVVYPGAVTAVTTYDSMDREVSIVIQRPGESNQTLASAAVYKAFGPLTTVNLGNTRSETRSFDLRYQPTRIQLSAGLFDWAYSTDDVGNVMAIDDQTAANQDRAFGYQDIAYFLNSASGPWPGPLSWSYDKIGNRLTETRGALTDTYSYTPNPATGNTPKLASVALGVVGTRTYTYGDAGHVATVAASGNTVTFSTDDASRTSRVERLPDLFTNFSYDGRDFLAQAAGEISPPIAPPAPDSVSSRGTRGTLIFEDGFESGDACEWTTITGLITPLCPKPTPLSATPTYTSDGVLRRLLRSGSTVGVDEILYFYFAGRAIAQLELDGGNETFKWLTTDHLGTPVVATSLPGAVVWAGGFEPFGKDFTGAQAAGVQLRFPGQWMDEAWEKSSLGAEVYYNVARFYEHQTGRYTSRDPLNSLNSWDLYGYAANRPLFYVDTHGRRPVRPETFGGPVPAPQCTNCDPHVPAIGGAVFRVCFNINNNTCQNVLREYGLLRCFQKRCLTPLPVVCIPSGGCDGEGCGGPCNNFADTTRQIFLQAAAFGGPCGGLADTVAHELAHMCGIGADNGNGSQFRENRRRADRIGKACGQ